MVHKFNGTRIRELMEEIKVLAEESNEDFFIMATYPSAPEETGGNTTFCLTASGQYIPNLIFSTGESVTEAIEKNQEVMKPFVMGAANAAMSGGMGKLRPAPDDEDTHEDVPFDEDLLASYFGNAPKPTNT